MAVGTTGLLLQALKDALFLRASTIGHDTLYWFFPVYHFFADNLLRGRFPYWNPFSHAGEPFYPVLLQLRMLEPVTFLSMALGSLFTSDLVTLFNWDRVARGLLGSLGAYLFLRQWATHWVTRISLIPVLLWSSFFLAALRQTGTIDGFISAPYVAYFLFRIFHFRDRGWVNWLGLGISVGLGWQSYYFVGVWIFLLFIAVGFAVFRPDDLRELFRVPHILRRAAGAGLIVGLMAVPNAVILLERENYVFPARMVDHSYQGHAPLGGPLQYEPGASQQTDKSVALPYDLVKYTGTFSTVWDFIQLIVPDGNPFARGPGTPGEFGRTSESFMYVGLLVYAGALLGLVAGRHEHKRIWLVVGTGFGLLLLGPRGGLHWLLYQIYPPIWFVRHTHTFVNFFVLALLYFYILGANRLTEWQGGRFFEANSNRGLLGRLLTTRRFSWFRAFALGRDLGRLGLFWGLLLTHSLLVLKFSPQPLGFLIHMGVFLGIPMAMLLLVRCLFRAKPPALVWALLLFLVLDLHLYLYSSSYLWTSRRPDETGAVSAKPVTPQSLETRVAAPAWAVLGGQYEQSIRYLEVASRVPAAFSAIMYSPDQPEAYFRSVQYPLTTNNSFESWISKQGQWTPIGWSVFPPEQVGPSARPTDAREGGVSAMVIPPPTGAAVIQSAVPKATALRGRFAWFSVWVKSANRKPDGVQIGLRMGPSNLAPPHSLEVTRSYKNSGEWEHLVVGARIRENDEKLLVILRVNSFADAPAFFDVASLDAVPVSPDGTPRDFQIEKVLDSRRWNSYLMLRGYFDLIHSGIPSGALEELMAISRPVVQFRDRATAIPIEAFASEVRTLYAKGSIRELGETVMLHTSPPALTAPPHQAGKEGRKPTFRSAVTRYDYNSLELSTESSTSGFLYYADGYNRHWSAFVDGKPAPVLRANGNFKAVPVEGGIHMVRFVYDPVPFRIGLYLFFGIPILAIALTVSGAIRRPFRYLDSKRTDKV